MLTVLLLAGLWAVAAPDREAAMTRAHRSFELSRAGRLDEAVSEMRAAINLAPQDPLLHSALGGLLSQQGKIAESFDSFIKAVELAPENTVLRSRLEEVGLEFGAQLARERRYRAGLAVAEDIARRFPESGPAQEMLGLFQTKSQQNVAATATYLRARQLAPDSAGAAVGLGVAAASAGLSDQATAAFEQALQKFPENSTALQAYGVFLLREAEVGRADSSQALRLLEKAIALDPSAVEAHFQLGSVALKDGHPERALDHLRKAVALGLDDSRVHYALARAYRRLGNTIEADRELARFHQRKDAEKP